MFYKLLKPLVTESEHFRGIPSIYEMKSMPVDTRNEKIKVLIRLIKVVNGIGYQSIVRGLELNKELNIKAYNQCFATATMYAAKPDVAVGSLVKAMVMLANDINIELPAVPNKEALDESLKTGEFDYFFNAKVTKEDKKEMEDRELDGSADLDWRVMSFRLPGETKEIPVSSRLEFARIKNSDLHHIIGTYDLSEEIDYIYNNVDKLQGNKRRFVLQDILVSLLFKQPYTRYNKLVKAKEVIDKQN